MGLAASEQAAEKQQKELDHEDANFGRRCRKINVFGGLRVFRYPQEKPTAAETIDRFGSCSPDRKLICARRNV
jgi:hypothetical protein